jgi:amino acid transporter
MGPFALALVAVLWSYDGWIEITYVGGEVKNPRRTIPRSIIVSTLIVILLYVLTNITYLSVLSTDAISTSQLVSADAATVLVGPVGATIAVLAIIIAMLGCNNGFVLTGARIYYAMAEDKMFFPALARIHPRYHTPVTALVCQGVWAVILVLISAFDQLFTYVVFASWIFYAMTVGAVFILRKRKIISSASYRTWGYPITPIIFIIFSLCLVVATIIENPGDTAIGLGIISLGLPAYFYWEQRSSESKSR